MEDDRYIVFLDDEPNILSSLSRIFIDDDFIIKTFTSGTEALEFVTGNPVQLVISDQRMPKMTGTEFFTRLREIRPDTIRILLTGFADLDATIEAINQGQIYKFMVKPWNDEELKATVYRALEHFDLVKENKRLLKVLKAKNLELEEWNIELGNRVKERTKLFVEKNLELSKLNNVLEESIVNTIKVFLNMMSLYSTDLSSHCRRVASVALTLAEQFGFSEMEMRDMEIAALMHDIGKLVLPRSVMEKPKNKLLDSEISLMQEHTSLGQRALEDMKRFDNVGKIILHHHERWDGQGYPYGLSEKEIPRESRLLAVCNTFDRLFNIEKGYDRTAVRNYFIQNSGIQFDPTMCKAIIRFIDQQTYVEVQASNKVNEVLPSELRSGMVLSNDLLTGNGIFLLPRGQTLREAHIESIQEMHKIDPIEGMIKVSVPPNM